MSAEADVSHRLVVWSPRSRLLSLVVGLPAGCGAAVGLAYLAWSAGPARVAGAAAFLLCLAALAALVGYRSALVFDAKVRVVQVRTSVFGRALRARHQPLGAVREVEILSSEGKGETRWYQVRLGELVVAPMLAGEEGRDAARVLARRLADHLSLAVVER